MNRPVPGVDESPDAEADEPLVPEEPAAETAADENAEPPPGAWALWRPSVAAGAWAWAAGAVLYVLATFVAWFPVQNSSPVIGPAPIGFRPILDSWAKWDTVWYVIIADSGYEADSRAAAFFPLYPLTVRVVRTVLFMDTFPAAMLVSAVSTLVALILVHRFVTEAVDSAHARRTTWYLLAFPTGFYLMAAYNESMFIALLVGSLYCMRRGHWWTAGVLAGFSGATRMIGVVLGLAFVYEYLRQRGFSLRKVRFDALAVTLVPVGLALYMLYLWNTFGDAMYFNEAQKAWFRDGYQWPWTTVADTWTLIATSASWLSPDTVRNIYNLLTVLLGLVFLGLALVGPWKLGRENAYLVIFSVFVLMLPVLSPIHSYYPLSSMLRYVLECLPIFMVLGKMGRSPGFHQVFLTAIVGLQGIAIVTYIQDNFVG
jgi:Gpi18-like mannosyltransferase